MTTGEKITEERKKLGLTQQQFADKLGVTRQAVSRWESDLAFPETDTLIAMSELFGCSIDYLIKYNGDKTPSGAESNAQKEEDNDKPKWGLNFSGGLPYFEYKSRTTLFGLPLVHVNIGLGRVAKGVFAFGLVSVGIVSFGLVSLGLLAWGMIALGLASLGAVSAGVIVALGGVAISAMIAFGGCAVGCFSFGGCAVGLFTFGGYSNGAYVAIGDYSVGGITFGDVYSGGTVIAVYKDTYAQQKDEAFALMDNIPAFWRGVVNLCKSLAHAAMIG